MSSEELQSQCETPPQHSIDEDTKQQQPQHGRRMSHFKEYKFFRSFSAKVENWPMRKAEALWRRMREKKIAGTNFPPVNASPNLCTVMKKIYLVACYGYFFDNHLYTQVCEKYSGKYA